MLEISALRNLRPLIATPCFDGTVFVNYLLGAIRLQHACHEIGMPLDFFFRQGDSLVTRSRNDCVAYFLANPHFTHLFWIDADIGFSAEAALRLLRYDRDVVAGVYPLARTGPQMECRREQRGSASTSFTRAIRSIPAGSAKMSNC